jgi:hypothetical protein
VRVGFEAVAQRREEPLALFAAEDELKLEPVGGFHTS